MLRSLLLTDDCPTLQVANTASSWSPANESQVWDSMYPIVRKAETITSRVERERRGKEKAFLKKYATT